MCVCTCVYVHIMLYVCVCMCVYAFLRLNALSQFCKNKTVERIIEVEGQHNYFWKCWCPRAFKKDVVVQGRDC